VVVSHPRILFVLGVMRYQTPTTKKIKSNCCCAFAAQYLVDQMEYFWPAINVVVILVLQEFIDARIVMLEQSYALISV
jgi:hypothetical protein